MQSSPAVEPRSALPRSLVREVIAGAQQQCLEEPFPQELDKSICSVPSQSNGEQSHVLEDRFFQVLGQFALFGACHSN